MASRKSKTRKSHRGAHQGAAHREGSSMEAKVDVRKLQILNDRINQTIEALNQVRLSVHGLGHTGMQPLGPQSFMGQGYGVQQGLGMQNPYLFGGQTPFQGFGGQLGQLAGQQGIGAGFGFQHSPYTPYQNPFVSPFTNPGVMQPWGVGQTGLTGSPFGVSPWSGLGGAAGGIGGGLFHSN